jgi:transmembrane sensor
MTPLHQDPSDPESALLARYLSDECTAAERQGVDRRIATDPSFAATVERLRAAWDHVSSRAAYDSSALWQRIAADTVDAPQRAETAPGPRLVRTHSDPLRLRNLGAPATRRRWAIAAGLGVIALGGTLWRIEQIRSDTAIVAAPATIIWKELATRAGQRVVAQLTDGTEVTLAPDSRIRYAVEPGSLTRDVELVGKAFFAVRHDSTRPFRVRTRNAVTEDLGTEFIVAAYPEVVKTRVVVASGSVAVRLATPGTGSRAMSDRVPLREQVLNRGDLGTVGGRAGILVDRGIDLSKELAWTRNVLLFDATPLDEAARAIGRWYDIDVKIADSSLITLPVTATFRDVPVTEVLERISLALRLKIERRGRTVILRTRDSSDAR